MPEPNPPEKKHLSNRALRLWLDYVYQEQDRTGSYATRQARESHLRIFVQTLYDSGYNPKPKNTRPKHIELALTNWAEGDIARRTIDNRLSTLRWFAAEIGKPNIVKRTNDEYKHASTQGKTQLHRQGPQSRQGIPGQGPRPPDACEPHPPTRVRPAAERGHHDPTTRSRPRQPHPPARQLGERRQPPRRAPDHPWTTAGPGRSKSPRSARQSPDTKRQGISPTTQRVYKTKQSRRAGLSNMHGLRHAYAQRRYRTLTRRLDPNGEGWHCPARGGLPQKDLSKENHKIDVQARTDRSAMKWDTNACESPMSISENNVPIQTPKELFR